MNKTPLEALREVEEWLLGDIEACETHAETQVDAETLAARLEGVQEAIKNNSWLLTKTIQPHKTMARQRKKYGTSSPVKGGMPHQKRGGTSGAFCDTSFGSKTNLHTSKKIYKTRRGA